MQSVTRAGKSNRAVSTPRERQADRLVRRRRARKRRRLLSVGAVMGVVAAFGWLQATGRLAEAGDALAVLSENLVVRAGLTVESVTVEGRDWTDRGALLRALDVARGQSLLHLDLEAMRERVETLGWVETADIYRTLPNRLTLAVRERVPFAVWQYEGRLRLIDRTGAVIVPVAGNAFAHLPLVVGMGAPDDAAGLETMLAAEPDLAKRVSAAIRVGDRRWNIRFGNGVEARLPADGPEAAWRALADLDRRHGLLEQDILHVDLRLEDRLVVRRRAVRFHLSGQEI